MNEEKIVENDLIILKSKIETLQKYRNNLKQKNDKRFIVMMTINYIIILLSNIIPLTLIPTAGQLVSIIISLSSLISLTGINTLLSYKALRKNEIKINSLNEEIDYLEGINNKMEEEIANAKEGSIDIKNISNKFDWRKQLKLIRIYNTNKSYFIKHYKKNDLYELLVYNNYGNADVYYLHERAREDVENKQKKKILVKDAISDLWKD